MAVVSISKPYIMREKKINKYDAWKKINKYEEGKSIAKNPY